MKIKNIVKTRRVLTCGHVIYRILFVFFLFFVSLKWEVVALDWITYTGEIVKGKQYSLLCVRNHREQ